MSSIVTLQGRATGAQQFAQVLLTSPTYVIVSDHLTTDANSLLDTSEYHYDVMSNSLFGKLVTPSDVALMVPNTPWVSGTIYTPYSDSRNDYSVVVSQVGSEYRVYKCIDNNKGAVSLSQPTSTSVNIVTTGDGYKWKFLFAVDQSVYNKFATTKVMPYVASANVASNASRSTIDHISVVNGGLKYDNYFEGTLRAQDLVGATTYGLVETASGVNDFYNGCLMIITDPTSAAVGQYRTITDYQVTGNTKVVTINAPFNPAPASTDEYKIAPAVAITSTNATNNVAVGYANINSAQSNTVQSIEILYRGSDHGMSTATVTADPVVPVVAQAVLDVVVSPAVGHGGNALVEARGTSVAVSKTVAEELPAAGVFSKVALVSGVRVSNVNISVGTGPATRFANGESVIFISTKGRVSNGATLSGSTVVSANGGVNQLSAGDYLVIGSGANTAMARVQSVVNATHVTVQGSYANVSGPVDFVTIASTGVVRTANSTVVTVDQCAAGVSAGMRAYGVTSRALDTVSSVSKDFSTIVGASRLVGTATGTFVGNEKVTWNGGSGYIQSVVTSASTTLWLTKVTGGLPTSGTVTGQTSGATLSVSAKYDSEITFGSAQLIYGENVVPVTRVPGEQQNIKLVVEF